MSRAAKDCSFVGGVGFQVNPVRTLSIYIFTWIEWSGGRGGRTHHPVAGMADFFAYEGRHSDVNS